MLRHLVSKLFFNSCRFRKPNHLIICTFNITAHFDSNTKYQYFLCKVNVIFCSYCKRIRLHKDSSTIAHQANRRYKRLAVKHIKKNLQNVDKLFNFHKHVKYNNITKKKMKLRKLEWIPDSFIILGTFLRRRNVPWNIDKEPDVHRSGPKFDIFSV